MTIIENTIEFIGWYFSLSLIGAPISFLVSVIAIFLYIALSNRFKNLPKILIILICGVLSVFVAGIIALLYLYIGSLFLGEID